MTSPVKAPKAITELHKGCQDEMFKRHCVWISVSVGLSLVLLIFLGADGSMIGGVLSPATLYGQELTDAIKRLGRK